METDESLDRTGAVIAALNRARLEVVAAITDGPNSLMTQYEAEELDKCVLRIDQIRQRIEREYISDL